MSKNNLILIFLLCSVFVQGQTSISLKEIINYPNHVVSLSNSGTYESMDVKVVNNYPDYRKIKVECGTVFRNHTNSEQNLVVLFRDELTINGGAQQEIKLTTACMDAAKSGPSSASNWSVDYDKGIGRLIEYYHTFRPAISLFTGPEYHETKDNQTTFLQMAVWTYYKCDKSHIVDFSAKYMFDGDKEAAELYVEVTYPLIEVFIENYKLLYDE